MSPIVLVVEDEPLSRIALADHLCDCGFEVREAHDARRALELLRAPNCLINLVISDVNMPGDMDGLDLCRWIRKNRPHIPVFMVSGDAAKLAAIRELCEGRTMTKPFNFERATAGILHALSAPPSL